MLEFIVNNIPGFIVGAVLAIVGSFFFWHNNKPLMDKLYNKAKEEFDPKEKQLRAEIDELKAKLQENDLLKKITEIVEQKVAEAINKLKG